MPWRRAYFQGAHSIEADTAATEKVESSAKWRRSASFQGENSIGQHILLLGKPVRIAGVAENMKCLNLRNNDLPELYLPYTQKIDELPSFTFVIKTRPGSLSLNSAFRTMLHDLAPDVPIGMTYTMEQQVDSSIGRERLMASLSIFFGALALTYGNLDFTGFCQPSLWRAAERSRQSRNRHRRSSIRCGFGGVFPSLRASRVDPAISLRQE